MARRPATLHLLCGKIAAGKSTLAAALAEAPGTVLISEDRWLARLYPGEIRDIADYARASRRLCTARRHFGSISRPIRWRRRAWMKGLLEGTGADHALHYLRQEDSTCRARLRARNAAGTHEYAASDAEYDLFTSHFVEPAEAEGLQLVIHD